MTQHSRTGGGQWVFRNQRWSYVSGDASGECLDAPLVRPLDLSTLIDWRDARRWLETVASAFPQPILVYRGRDASLAGSEAAVSLEFSLWPPWWRRLTGSVSWLSSALEDAIALLVKDCWSSGLPLVRVGAVQGLGRLRADPMGGDETPSGSRVFAVVVCVGFSRQDFEGDLDIHGRWSEEGGLGTAVNRQELLSLLPDESQEEHQWKMVRTVVAGMMATVRGLYHSRMELALEQGRSRHYLMRAEGLERQLLSQSGGDLGRVPEAYGLEPELLKELIASPILGVTVEDTHHNVRWVSPHLKKIFGNVIGEKCYKAFRGTLEPCANCPIHELWNVGREQYEYVSVSPPPEQRFLVRSIPVVARNGERLVMEVGVNVTNLLQSQSERDRHMEAMDRRLRRIQELTRRMNLHLLEQVCQMEDLTDDLLFGLRKKCESAPGGEANVVAQSLLELGQSLGGTISDLKNLSLSLGAGGRFLEVDLQHLLVSISHEWTDRVPGLVVEMSQGSFPTVRSDPVLLNMILHALIERMLGSASCSPRLSIRYQTSGYAAELASGQDFHVLTLGCSGSFTLSEKGAIQGLPELLALRLGGAVWLHKSDGGTSLSLSFPRSVDTAFTQERPTV